MLSRTDRDEVIAFILEEFEQAASALNSQPQGDGRLAKPAVLALRAECMLYESRLGNIPWTETLAAINLAKSEADSSGHELIDDYAKLFTESNEGNKEILFAVVNSSEDRSTDISEDRCKTQIHFNLHFKFEVLALDFSFFHCF